MNNTKSLFNIKSLSDFYGSDLFLGVCAIATLVCWSLNFVVMGFVVLAVLACVLLLTQSSLKGLFAIVAFAQFVAFEDMDQVVNKFHIVCYIIVGACVLACVGVYFVKNFILHKKKLTLGKLWVGLLTLSVAVVLAGCMCPTYDKSYTWLALAFVAGVCLVYFLMINTTDDSMRDYIAKLFVWMGILVSAQMVIYYSRCESLEVFYSYIYQKHLFLGWGMSNSTASVLAFCVPFAFYFASKEKPWLYLPLAVVFSVGILLSCSRGNILFSALVFPIALVFAWIKSKNKISFSFTVVAIAFVVAGVIFAVEDELAHTLRYLEEYGMSDNGRFKIWDYAMEVDYANNKIFGAGFFGEDNLELFGDLKKYHSTVVQILASAGIVGAIGFMVHYVQRYQLVFTRFSVFKFFAFASLIVYELYGMIDINILRIYETMMVLYILVACEKETEQTREPILDFGKKKLALCAKGDKCNMSTNEKQIEETTENTTEAVLDVEDTSQNAVEQPAKKKVKHKFYRYFFKRFLDVVLSGLMLIILSPVFLCLWILGRLFVSKQVIFRQLRPGKDNKIFVFYKFKSMTDEKDENGNMLPDSKRLKKYGKFLRKTSLDELPQLWNVFKGDMSFIGPRPKLVKDMIFYNDYQNRRSEVRPGITGYAQANGRNLNTWKQTFDYDVYYVENMSLWMDIKIIFKTAFKILAKKEVTTQDQATDAYYFGNQLLNTNQITEEEYKEKIKEAHDIEAKIIEDGNYNGKIFCSDQCV